MKKPVLFSIVESPMHPDFSALYRRHGIDEIRINSIRKALTQQRTVSFRQMTKAGFAWVEQAPPVQDLQFTPQRPPGPDAQLEGKSIMEIFDFLLGPSLELIRKRTEAKGSKPGKKRKWKELTPARFYQFLACFLGTHFPPVVH